MSVMHLFDKPDFFLTWHQYVNRGTRIPRVKERVGKADSIARALFLGAFSLELALRHVLCNRLNLLTLTVFCRMHLLKQWWESGGDFCFSGNEDYGLKKPRKKKKGRASFRMTGWSGAKNPDLELVWINVLIM